MTKSNLKKIILPITLILITLTQKTIQFIAYDCHDSKLNITTFNTLNVDHCTPPILSKIEQLPTIKLLQKIETKMIKYISCYITADYLITRCSTLEDAQIVAGGYYSELITIGGPACSQAHNNLFHTFPQGHMARNLIINQTIYFNHIISGQADDSGNCHGSTYHSEKHTWTNVIVQAKYKIHLSDGTAIANNKEDLLILPTGTKLKLSKSYGIDSHKGEVIWDNELNENCQYNEYDTLYEGPASLITAQKSANSAETQTYLVESDKVTFALKKVSITFACSVPAIQTEHPRLLIISEPIFIAYFKMKPISPYNMDLLAYINTKFVYIENIIQSTITSMYIDIITKQCNLERKLLKQQLSLASYCLSEFAYTMGQGPGYSALKYGEAVYLQQCKPVEVELFNDNEHCFQELPVLLNNFTFYMAPKTHTLQKYGTQIECSDILPAAYLMEGEWISMTPHYRTAPKIPQMLKPDTAWTWTFQSPERLMTTGLYNKQQIDNLQKLLLYPQEIDAAQSNIARQTMGYNTMDQGLKIRPIIDEDAMEKLLEQKLRKLWGWFTFVGNFMSGLLGIFCICKLIMITLNATLNMSILYQTFGCSFQILAGIFSGLTHYVMHKAHNKKQTKNTSLNKTRKNETNLTKHEQRKKYPPSTQLFQPSNNLTI